MQARKQFMPYFVSDYKSQYLKNLQNITYLKANFTKIS